MKKIHDTLLLCFDSTQGGIPVLIVARKGRKGEIIVVNSFKENDAKDLYEMLLDGKEKYETTKETNV